MKQLLVIFTLLLGYNVHAQHWCGFDQILEKNLPTKNFTIGDPSRVNYPKTIPTIVHVLYNGEKCCPYDAGDAYGVGTHVTENVVGGKINFVNTLLSNINSNIELCLAQSNNFGSINAIQYHNIYDVFDEADIEGLPNWDVFSWYEEVRDHTIVEPEYFLNIYLYEWLTTNPVGFASFPPGPNCWVKTSAFTPNYATTLIHEIGHWAGLLHTFSDGFSGIYTCVTALDEVDCENEGDYVCDTPPTGMDFSCLDACPTIYSPWGGEVIYEGIPEVSESYMSYAPDACQWMFTQGQIDRMHEQLEIHRSALIGENTFCEPYSNPTACQGDFNGDGMVGIEDLLAFLLIYGTSCE